MMMKQYNTTYMWKSVKILTCFLLLFFSLVQSYSHVNCIWTKMVLDRFVLLHLLHLFQNFKWLLFLLCFVVHVWILQCNTFDFLAVHIQKIVVVYKEFQYYNIPWNPTCCWFTNILLFFFFFFLFSWIIFIYLLTLFINKM